MKTPMNRLFLVLLCVPFVLEAQGVDREELERQITKTVEFQNYQGPYDRIDTIDAIRAIGFGLAREQRISGESVTFGGRYRIIHAVDPDILLGLDADIMMILSGARVDHINNIRRILGAYLEEAYGYSSSQALVIAEFVTIYNAIYRGDISFYAGRYKPIVMRNVSTDSVGISTRYDEWPGRTQMVIPLRGGLAGAVDPIVLSDERVIAELRDREDMALEQRREMIDLAEESIEREEQRVAEREQQISEQRELAEQERRDIAVERDAIEAERDRIPPEQVRRREQEVAEREAAVAETDREIGDRELEAAQAREETERMTERVRELREEVAEDTRTVMEAAPVAVVETAEVLFLQTTLRAGRPVGRLVVIDSATATILRRSSLDLVTSRVIHRWGADHLLIAEREGTARLLRVEPTTLEPAVASDAELFAESVVVPRPDRGEIYAVVRDGSGWYLGKFSGSLSLMERSSMEVDPYTQITVAGVYVFVQRSDGSIAGLSLEDLTRR